MDEKDAEIERLRVEVERVNKKEAAREKRKKIIMKVLFAVMWTFNGLLFGGLAAKIIGG